MANNLNVYAAGLVASGSTIDAANFWASNLKLSCGLSSRDRKLVLDRDTYVGFTNERRILFMGLKKGRYSPSLDRQIESTGLFLDSVPAEIYALGAPWAAYRQTGPIIRTLGAFKLASRNKFFIHLDAHSSCGTVPSWMEQELQRLCHYVSWIPGDKDYPDVELELKWNDNGSVDKVVFSNRQYSCFAPHDYHWQRKLPLLFNGTQHITTDGTILAAILHMQMYGMVAFSGLSADWLTTDDRQRLRNAYINLLTSAEALALVVNKRGLGQLAGLTTDTGSRLASNRAAAARSIRRLWALRCKSTYRRIFYVGKQFWLGMDENGEMYELIPDVTPHCPDDEYMDVLAGLVFALELEFRTGKKHNPVQEILNRCNAILSNGNLKKFF